MLNAAQRSEASFAIEYQLSTELVISNSAQRSEGSYKAVYQLYTELVISSNLHFFHSDNQPTGDIIRKSKIVNQYSLIKRDLRTRINDFRILICVCHAEA